MFKMPKKKEEKNTNLEFTDDHQHNYLSGVSKFIYGRADGILSVHGPMVVRG